MANMKNFHLLLPEETYTQLRTEAERTQVPATALAREAIEFWLRERLRKARLVPRSGSEQTGRRPVILVSHDSFNQTAAWKSIIVAPISTSASQGKRGPTAVELPGGSAGLPKASFSRIRAGADRPSR